MISLLRIRSVNFLRYIYLQLPRLQIQILCLRMWIVHQTVYVCLLVLMCIYCLINVCITIVHGSMCVQLSVSVYTVHSLLFEDHQRLSFVILSAIHNYDSLYPVKLFEISNEHIHTELRLRLQRIIIIISSSSISLHSFISCPFLKPSCLCFPFSISSFSLLPLSSCFYPFLISLSNNLLATIIGC